MAESNIALLLTLSLFVLVSFDDAMRHEPNSLKVVFDTSSLVAGGRAFSQVLRGRIAYIPVVVIQELLRQIGEPNRERPARSALAEIEKSQMKYLPDIKDRIRGCFGLPMRFWPHSEDYLRILVHHGASGTPWAQISAMGDALYLSGQVETSMTAFVHEKEKAEKSFAQEVQQIAENERKMGPEALRGTAERRGMELPLGHLRKGRKDLREDFTSRGYRRMWLFNQMAAVVNVAGAFEKVVNSRYSDCTPEDLYKQLLLHYQGGLGFVLGMFESAWSSFVLGQQNAHENDYFDLLIMASVGDTEDWVFVTEERKWLDVGKSAGFADRLMSVADLDRNY